MVSMIDAEYLADRKRLIEQLYKRVEQCLSKDMITINCVETVDELAGWLMTFITETPICICGKLSDEDCKRYCELKRELQQISFELAYSLMDEIASAVKREFKNMDTDEQTRTLALMLSAMLFKHNTEDFITELAKKLDIEISEEDIEATEYLEPLTTSAPNYIKLTQTGSSRCRPRPLSPAPQRDWRLGTSGPPICKM